MSEADSPTRRTGRARRAIFIAASVICLGAFASIVVEAGDNAGVYEVARQYTTAGGGVRLQLPQIFQSTAARQPSRSVAFAPGYGSYGAESLVLPPTGKRSLDRDRRMSGLGVHSGRSRSASAARAKPPKDTYLNARTSYCVRSCDGFFFPLGNPDTGSLAAHEAACARACPAAETAVYVASAGSKGIEDAVDRRGRAYQATRTAFNHRTQFDSACTCNGAPGQARNHSLMNDFTLRSGDLVMSREGLKVFRGGDQGPHRASRFVGVAAADLSASERRWAQSTEAASIRGMQGARVSATLQQRIEAQLRAARGAPAEDAGLRGGARAIPVSDGRPMRYVGPDVAMAHR